MQIALFFYLPALQSPVKKTESIRASSAGKVVAGKMFSRDKSQSRTLGTFTFYRIALFVLFSIKNKSRNSPRHHHDSKSKGFCWWCSCWCYREEEDNDPYESQGNIIFPSFKRRALILIEILCLARFIGMVSVHLYICTSRYKNLQFALLSKQRIAQPPIVPVREPVKVMRSMSAKATSAAATAAKAAATKAVTCTSAARTRLVASTSRTDSSHVIVKPRPKSGSAVPVGNAASRLYY